jgi:hypothetical protein
MWNTRAILRKLFKRKALLVHIIDGLRPHGAPFDLLVTNERPLFLFHDFLSSRWVRDFVNTAGADVGVGTDCMARAIPTGDFRERSNLISGLLPLALQFRWCPYKRLLDLAQLSRTTVQKGAGRLDDLLLGRSCVVACHTNVFLMQNHLHQVERNTLDLV